MRRVLMILGLLLLCLPVTAGEKTAVISGASHDAPTISDSVACEMRVKSVLRELGYRVILRTSKESAYLQVNTWCSCYRRDTFDHICSAGATVRRNGNYYFTIHSGSERGSSYAWALDEVCRMVANRLRVRLGGGSGTQGDSLKPSKPKKTEQLVVVRWKGLMKPMPLIKLTGYFKDMGYRAKMLKSGSNQVRFKVTIEEQPGRFRSKLQTFLEAHYRIVSTGGKSKLNFQIEAL